MIYISISILLGLIFIGLCIFFKDKKIVIKEKVKDNKEETKEEIEEKVLDTSNENKKEKGLKYKGIEDITIGDKTYHSIEEASKELLIQPTTIRYYFKNYSPDIASYKLAHYRHRLVKEPQSPIIIEGRALKEYSRKELALKLKISYTSLNKWYAEGILVQKLNEYRIDYRKILGLEEPKPVNETKKQRKENNNNYPIKVSDTIPERYLIKYNIKKGDTFKNYGHFIEYIGVSPSLVYDWERKHYIEKII